jgi:CRP-like cAMP-binding protein
MSPFVILTRGRVQVVNDAGKQLAILTEGAYFGEVAVLKDAPRTASIFVLEDCEVYTLRRDSVFKLTQAYPEFAKHVQEARKSYGNN